MIACLWTVLRVFHDLGACFLFFSKMMKISYNDQIICKYFSNFLSTLCERFIPT